MSCNRFVEVWGSAEGPARTLAPATRLGIGALWFASVLANDPAQASGLAVTLLVVLPWFVMVKPPRLLLGPLLLFAFTLFAPFVLFTPWVTTTSGPAADLMIPMPWAVAWRILIKGTAALLVTTWTASTMSLHELETALVNLRVPGPLAELLLQIIHQAHALAEETRMMSQAVRVRGALAGWGAMLSVATALPRVWLPRVLYRADRVGDAMEIRGYELDENLDSTLGLGTKDYLMLAWAGLVLAGSLYVRIYGS